MRRGALFIICGLLALFVVRHWNEEPPLLIDGASVARAKVDDFCDVPFRQRAPLPKYQRNRALTPWGVPNGDTA